MTAGLQSLIAAWRARADELRPYATPAAAAFDRAADELERHLTALELEPLNLQQAAAESGYSPDHLGRQVKQGKIPNAGRPRAPLILRRDLPRKPAALPGVDATISLVGVGPRQIARAVVTSKSGATR